MATSLPYSLPHQDHGAKAIMPNKEKHPERKITIQNGVTQAEALLKAPDAGDLTNKLQQLTDAGDRFDQDRSGRFDDPGQIEATPSPATYDLTLGDAKPPSPVSDDELRSMHAEEDQFRDKLVAAGCPPCLPVDEKYLFHYDYAPGCYHESNPAAKYYLRKDRDRQPLRAQFFDWNSLGNFQYSQRHHPDVLPGPGEAERGFREYIEEIKTHLRERNLTESAELVALSLDVTKQDALQNWLEFMAMHLDIHVGLVHRAKNYPSYPAISWRMRAKARHDHHVKCHNELFEWLEEQRVIISERLQAAKKTDETDETAKAEETAKTKVTETTNTAKTGAKAANTRTKSRRGNVKRGAPSKQPRKKATAVDYEKWPASAPPSASGI
ncbi:uncharacterized protein SPSK_00129 [Sporothrix schenckii 1099-18]|uniref:Uncharacterized protein n=1 Tax=Sporothrix schenckii 1099-18 TaxID=1397361 RepID=A0A0F2M1Z1_SPOSC|nr:uncharacterized protein SPSK_00129 [Sporothrix schenckii 1099-18]KJR83722.1 hypothetical protein SPSK_00129 [Sporothrix schenckii 1099-18]